MGPGTLYSCSRQMVAVTRRRRKGLGERGVREEEKIGERQGGVSGQEKSPTCLGFAWTQFSSSTLWVSP